MLINHAIAVYLVMPGAVQIGYPLLVGIIAFSILHRSAKKNEDRYWAQRYQQQNPAEHELVDNEASMGAWIAATVVVFGALAAFVYGVQVFA